MARSTSDSSSSSKTSGKASGKAAKKDSTDSRRGQMRAAWKMTREIDKRLLPYVLLASLGTFAVIFGIGLAIGNPITFGILAIAAAFPAGLIVFARRAQRAALSQVEGQPGAAAAVLNTLRKGFTVTPAVAVTRNQDIVHRVTGRAGVVLVAEGKPSSAINLLSSERKKVARVAGDAPIHEILMGDGEGQVPLRKITRTVMKLPKALEPAAVTDLNFRLKALDAQRGQLPIPKGPLPKGVRMPRNPAG